MNNTEKEIVKHRGEEAAPVLQELNQRATALLTQFEKQKVKLSSKLEQALTYLTKHWEELTAYVKIYALPPVNTGGRAILP